MPGNTVRLQKPEGLASFLQESFPQKDLSKVYFYFDFDKTLTNGYEFSGNENKAPIEKRIRGGKKTVDALDSLKQRGGNLSVVTARSPKVSVIDQLKASLDNSVSELNHIFVVDEKPVIETFGDVQVARGSSLYAAGRQKEVAIAHSLAQNAAHSGPLDVIFVDDAVANAFAVWDNLRKVIKDQDMLDRINLTVCWWDTYMEEVESFGTPSMIPTHSTDPDFSYHDYLGSHLEKFGVNEEERKKIENEYKT